MIYRRMGRTGLQLSALSFGSWVSFHQQIGDSTADELMSLAYEQGINFFDNAEGYALGESEKMMGRVLRSKDWDRSSYVLSSKVFFGWREPNKPNQTGLSRKHIVEACNEALNRLQTDYWIFISAIVPILQFPSRKWCGPCTTCWFRVKYFIGAPACGARLQQVS